MKKANEFVVIYDITSDKERAKVDHLLKGYGFRIQKSVFQCRLTRAWQKELVDKLENLEIKTGFVRIYRLDYSSRKADIGQEAPKKDDGHAYII